MKKKRKPKRRIETGRYQTEGDWPGYFIRGDDCILLAGAIRKVEDFFRSHGLPDDLAPALVKLTEHRETIERDVILNPRKGREVGP